MHVTGGKIPKRWSRFLISSQLSCRTCRYESYTDSWTMLAGIRLIAFRCGSLSKNPIDAKRERWCWQKLSGQPPGKVIRSEIKSFWDSNIELPWSEVPVNSPSKGHRLKLNQNSSSKGTKKFWRKERNLVHSCSFQKDTFHIWMMPISSLLTHPPTKNRKKTKKLTVVGKLRIFTPHLLWLSRSPSQWCRHGYIYRPGRFGTQGSTMHRIRSTTGATEYPHCQ